MSVFGFPSVGESFAKFVDRVALVTGGGSGHGEAIGKALAAKGASVVLSDINLTGAQRVAREIADAGGTASAILQDVARPEESETVVGYAVDTYGALHDAVNNAGIGGAQAPAGETDLAEWERVIDINGVLYGMRYQIPAMLEAGPAHCAIVDMASTHGVVASIGNGAYTAAQHGVVGLSKNAATEYGPPGLRINTPVGVETHRQVVPRREASSIRPARGFRRRRASPPCPIPQRLHGLARPPRRVQRVKCQPSYRPEETATLPRSF